MSDRSHHLYSSSSPWWRCCSRRSCSWRCSSAHSSSILRNTSSRLSPPCWGPPLRVSLMEPASSSSSLRFSIAMPIPCTSSRASLGDIPPSSIMASARERNLSISSRLCSLAYTRRTWLACMGVLWRGALKPSFAAIDDIVDWALPTIRAIAPWESPPSLSNETILALSSGVSGGLCLIGKAPFGSLAINHRGTHDYLVIAWLAGTLEKRGTRAREELLRTQPSNEDSRVPANHPSPGIPRHVFEARRGPTRPFSAIFFAFCDHRYQPTYSLGIHGANPSCTSGVTASQLSI